MHPRFIIVVPCLILSHRFRWVFCQLEVLRHCFPANLRRTLKELPRSLDETYNRILNEISNANHEHAYRLLQFLMVARSPLRVEELADVLAVDLNAGGNPKVEHGLTVGRPRRGGAVGLLQFGFRSRQRLLPSYSVLAFLREGIPNLGSPCELQGRGIPISYFHRTFPRDSCPGLSRHPIPPGRPHGQKCRREDSTFSIC